MITAQFFFSFSEDRGLPVIPLTDVTLSDHFPIYFSITWQSRARRATQTQFFLNTSVLTHKSTMSHILQIWNLEPRPHSDTGWIQWWNDAIARTARFLRIYGRQPACYRKRAYEANTKALRSASKALTLNPFDTELQLKLAKLRHEKKIADAYAARGAQIKARLHWLEVGDKVSKEFFQALKARHTNAGIQKIKQGLDTLTELPTILQAFVQHYEQVFASQGNSAARDEALRACIAVTPNRLAVEQRAFCEQFLTISDLKEAVFSMANDKSPGCDGFPCEFYKHL